MTMHAYIDACMGTLLPIAADVYVDYWHVRDIFAPSLKYVPYGELYKFDLSLLPSCHWFGLLCECIVP